MTIKKFPHHPESIPDEMLLGECFVVCDPEKVPLIAIPSGTIITASSTEPDTWRDHTVALETYTRNAHISGVGRVLTIDDPYVGVDLDKCLYREIGEIEPWALRIIEELDSYSEISPSGCGIKIWVKVPDFTRSYKKAQVEIYSRGRYFTVTGTPLSATRSTVEYREAELNSIIDREFPKVARHNSYGSRSGKLRSSFNLEDLLDRAGIEKRLRDDTTTETKYEIVCPWIAEHTGSPESGTRIGKYEDGGLWFKCEHSHCASRTWADFKFWLKSIVYRGRPPRSKGRRL